MTLTQWFVFFLVVQIIHFAGTWKLYSKAGRKSWEAAIPVYNAIILMKIINRPSWWTVLLFIPIVNLIMFPVVWVETLRSFGKNSTLNTVLGLVTFGLYIYYINYAQDVKYIQNRSLVSATKAGDTVSSVLFAVVVATLVHTYVVQPFTIPSASLEKSLLIGDFLFVSKLNYGPRVPKTAVALPMVHDSAPLLKVKSYLNSPQAPYFRFPGFEEIKNNDIVVFNWPRDTLFNMYLPADKRYDKPIDKKTNYVKRCVGIPGDSLQIIKGIVYINGKELNFPERARPQYGFNVKLKNPVDETFLNKYDLKESIPIFKIKPELWDNTVVKDFLKKENIKITEISRDSTHAYIMGGINQDVFSKLKLAIADNFFQANLTTAKAKSLQSDTRVAFVKRSIKDGAEDGIYPDFQDGKSSISNNWNSDNMGPIYIPQEGQTINLDLKNLPLYKILIKEYEGNDLKVIGNDIFINNKIANTYTFKQNYYWMMGDNRNNSLDARYFGYTPEDHIVGKPVFIWMSIDQNEPWSNISKKIRWERLFTFVHGEGEPYSYFKFFLIGLAAYFGISFLIKKRAA